MSAEPIEYEEQAGSTTPAEVAGSNGTAAHSIAAADGRAEHGAVVEPAFVGRAEELAALDAQFEAATRGSAGLVMLEAESGGGKTRLLDELAHRAASAGAWILRAQGIEQVASSPLPAIVGIAQEIVSRASLDPALVATIREALGDLQGAVCAVLPELAEVLEPKGPVDLGPEAFGEARVVEGLTTLLESLGSSAQPAVVILDDCQWADDSTLKLLQHWSTHAPAARHVTVIVSFRSEAVTSSHALRHIQNAAHVVLRPFSESEIRQLIESMAGNLPGEAVSVAES